MRLILCLLLVATTEPKPVTLDVLPKVAVINEYRPQTFRIRITIPKHEDNRLYSFSMSCGAELKTAIREVEGYSVTMYEDFHVTDDCFFQVCLHRAVEGKVKNLCVDQTVPTG